MDSDPKTPTALRVTTSKLSSKRLPFLKLPAAFPALIPKGKVSTMSWDNQMSAEEGRDLVSGLETVSHTSMLELLNMIHGSAELASQLGRECDMTVTVTHYHTM